MDNQTKNKIRLDVYLYENGFFESREKARIAIMEGKVFVENQKEDKPGTMIKTSANVEYRGEKLKYVSRGGYKLEKAVDLFKIDLMNKICMDIGSSTGGFTDLMLQNGAKKVYAVDCGTNQLDYKLRVDDRVVVMENTNARYLTNDDIEDGMVDFISVDVSFISLDKILPVIDILLKDSGVACMLIKPQFEAGKDVVRKNGVITDKKIHKEVIKTICELIKQYNFSVSGLTYSPIKGPAGNIEFLVYIGKKEQMVDSIDIESVVEEAHICLN